MKKKDFINILFNLASNHSPDLVDFKPIMLRNKKFYRDKAFEVWRDLDSRLSPKRTSNVVGLVELGLAVVTTFALSFKFDVWTSMLIAVSIALLLDFILTGEFMDFIKTVFVIFLVEIKNEVGIKLFFGYQSIELSYYDIENAYRKVRIRDTRKITTCSESSRIYLVHGSKVHNVIFDFATSNKVSGMGEYADKAVEEYTKTIVQHYYLNDMVR